MEVKIPELPELKFEDSLHQYSVDGIVIPSVTQIMKPLSQNEYEGIGEKTLEAAAQKGSAVHGAIENWIKFGIMDIEPEFQGYIDGFLNWWDSYKPEVIGSEIKTYHKIMWYGGTVDLLCRIDKDICLIDYKTTFHLLQKNCAVQLEAYSQALASQGVETNTKYILHLKKDGKWDFRPFLRNDTKSWRVFTALKIINDFISEK